MIQVEFGSERGFIFGIRQDWSILVVTISVPKFGNPWNLENVINCRLWEAVWPDDLWFFYRSAAPLRSYSGFTYRYCRFETRKHSRRALIRHLIIISVIAHFLPSVFMTPYKKQRKHSWWLMGCFNLSEKKPNKIKTSARPCFFSTLRPCQRFSCFF